MGSASYKSFPNSDQTTGTPYTLEFAVSHSLADRIFSLIRQLDFLRGRYHITQNLNPAVVSYSLTYNAGVTHNTATYTTTKDLRIRELTHLFRKISDTVNTGRLLDDMRSQSPSELELKLRELQLQQKNGTLIEFQIIVPTLRQIAFDPNLPQPTRQLAQSILNQAHAPSQERNLRPS